MSIFGSGVERVCKANLNSFALAHGVGTPDISAPNLSAVPMDIMRKCGEALDIIAELAEKGTQIAISDAGCGAAACKAAIQAASLNGFINTKSMKDRDYAMQLEKEADELLAKYTELADEIYGTVVGKLR